LAALQKQGALTVAENKVAYSLPRVC
jgi:hypothetical protein